MPSFLSQTTFCPTCGGTGYTDIEDNKLRAKCADCQGNGVFVKQTDALLFFNSSSYFDFGKRAGIKSKRAVYLVIFGALTAVAIGLMYYLFLLGNQYLGGVKLTPF